ncbi:hypothetical protein NEFER03_2127 [Nematocida sp. LUAm3]|nr:hypothetical protein NEFER03_2127 [Nematocida sp. LUAm3]KAI5175621.1 hypothetical protein NEFER02_1508 [Nematocida sp. LUAm2]KAI5178527.1 hypothetical protein NEFER01_1663 [Nematocida sp. LUAm1]
MDEGNRSKKSLSHFLENRNFPAVRRNVRKREPSTSEKTSSENLIIVDGKVIMNDMQARDENFEERITSFSYGKPYAKRGKWSKEETALFYKALSICGTDFSLLEKVFMDKERKQLKNKFTKEEKEHPERITHALGLSRSFSKEELTKLAKEYIHFKNMNK